MLVLNGLNCVQCQVRNREREYVLGSLEAKNESRENKRVYSIAVVKAYTRRQRRHSLHHLNFMRENPTCVAMVARDAVFLEAFP